MGRFVRKTFLHQNLLQNLGFKQKGNGERHGRKELTTLFSMTLSIFETAVMKQPCLALEAVFNFCYLFKVVCEHVHKLTSLSLKQSTFESST